MDINKILKEIGIDYDFKISEVPFNNEYNLIRIELEITWGEQTIIICDVLFSGVEYGCGELYDIKMKSLLRMGLNRLLPFEKTFDNVDYSTLEYDRRRD